VTLLLEAFAFVLGVYLSIRVIAALHGAVDLWYAIGREWPRLLARIVGWSAACLAAAWLFEARRSALAGGLLGFLAFYLSLFVIRHPLLRALRASNRASPSDPA
jgi:hypothetical protein